MIERAKPIELLGLWINLILSIACLVLAVTKQMTPDEVVIAILIFCWTLGIAWAIGFNGGLGAIEPCRDC